MDDPTLTDPMAGGVPRPNRPPARPGDSTITNTGAGLSFGSPQPDLSGTTLGGYRLVRMIAQGGMGVVYEAVQVNLDRTVALKILNDNLSEQSEFLLRFEREAKAAAALNHPHVVQVYDFVSVEGRRCLIMEFIEGEDLSACVARTGKIPIPEALTVVQQAAEALRFACGKSIIHRDIKPSNLMLTREGRVKVSDLGLAKILNETSDVTMTGAGMGSPHFMAPEQAEDAGNSDHRSDIYSLGITLLFLVTGKRAFEGASPFSVVLAHAKKPLPSGAQLGTELPEPIEMLIARMSAKDPNQRYSTYDELLTDIERVRSGMSPAPTSTGKRRPSPFVWISSVIILTLVASFAVWLTRKEPKQQNSVDPVIKTNAAARPSDTGPGEGSRPERRRGPAEIAEGDRPPLDGPPDEEPFNDSNRPGGGRPRGPRIPGLGPPPEPNGISIPFGTFDEMMKVADDYAKANPTRYREIMDCYRQLKEHAVDPADEMAVNRKLKLNVEAQNRAAREVIERLTTKMREALAQGKTNEALAVWAEYPPNLRSFPTDQEIRRRVSELLPSLR
jgi:serine/threonine protein kinase